MVFLERCVLDRYLNQIFIKYQFTKTVDDWWDARKRMKGSRRRNREQSSCRGFNEFWSRFVCLANSLWSFACVYLWMIGLIRMQTQATDTTIICRIKHATRWILYRKLANSAALCAGTLVIIEWMVDWDSCEICIQIPSLCQSRLDDDNLSQPTVAVLSKRL